MESAKRRLNRLENRLDKTAGSGSRCACKPLHVMIVDQDEDGRYFDSRDAMHGVEREVPAEVVKGHRACAHPQCVNRGKINLIVVTCQPSEGGEVKPLKELS